MHRPDRPRPGQTRHPFEGSLHRPTIQGVALRSPHRRQLLPTVPVLVRLNQLQQPVGIAAQGFPGHGFQFRNQGAIALQTGHPQRPGPALGFAADHPGHHAQGRARGTGIAFLGQPGRIVNTFGQGSGSKGPALGHAAGGMAQAIAAAIYYRDTEARMAAEFVGDRRPHHATANNDPMGVPMGMDGGRARNRRSHRAGRKLGKGRSLRHRIHHHRTIGHG